MHVQIPQGLLLFFAIKAVIYSHGRGERKKKKDGQNLKIRETAIFSVGDKLVY